MDRRATLGVLLGKGASTATLARPLPPDDETTLAPYNGSWGFEQAAHLLRRAMFSPTLEQIKEALNNGLDATIEQLFQDLPMPEPPVNYKQDDDPYVPIGTTWVNAPYPSGDSDDARDARRESLQAWAFGLLFTEGISIREKMTLFWHNHFALNDIEDPKYLYRYITLLRANALGNFRTLAKDVTIDPAMLRFLNGNQNTKKAPNENYARELLELFTTGKGEFAGPGDYTRFAEQDVVEMARVLTGWRDRGYMTDEEDKKVEAYFDEARHDTTPKQLSHRFNNTIINDMGDQEYSHLVDIIFQSPHVARFISRKLYRWFVYYKITESVETNVIEPMAQMLVDNDFEVKPVIKALLKSEHFFNILSVGPMIKNPIDFVVSVIKPLAGNFPDNLAERHNHWERIFDDAANMQMEYFFPPEVAGWKPYYQEPAFYRIWINASTLNHRMGYVDDTIFNGSAKMSNGLKHIDLLAFIKTLDDPYDPNKVIESIGQILFPQPLIVEQVTALKEILLPGLPDYEWGVEYTDYEANPNDIQLADAIESKLQELVASMMKMAEFYLS